ncbi:MAG: tetratricopeptide repeat protein, partial [Dehalococcoidales bacterium]
YARAYYLRSRVNNAMGNLDQAIKDAQTATRMNPLDLVAARQRVVVLHERNTRLNQKLSIEQQAETEQALRAAITLNTNNWSLQSLYAQYRSSEHPEDALAQLQFLQERIPNIANHLLVANLATTMSRSKTDDEEKAGLLEIAGLAYEKAYAMAPDNSNIQQRYSEFLRLTGRQDDVEKIFTGKDDVLWRFYLRDGRYNKAAQILHRLNEQDPRKLTIIRGLALVARLTGDKEGVRTYCEQILDIEDTVDNQLLQIEMYLETGLVKEAELKLASFRERHPQELRGLLLNAWLAMVKGDLEKALSLVNRNLELDSENAAAWRLRGNINRLRRDYGQAVADLQKSKGLQPNADISLELALAYRQSNRMPAAIGELISAIKDPMAPARLTTILERFYEESQQKTALKAFYDNLIAKYPDTEHWYFRASRFYMRESNLKKAEELLQKAWVITQKKDNPSIIIFDSYLEVLWRQGQYQNVLSIASKYIDVPAMASVAYSQMGQSQARMSNRDLAVQYYHKALEKCSNDDTLIIGTLRNMTQAVGTAEVDKWVASKLKASPDSLIANMVAFHLAQRSGQYSKALQYIENSMAVITPSGPMYPQYSAHRAVTLVMGYVKTSDKKYLSQAVEQYEKILDAQAMNLQALNNLAYLLAENNEQLDKAEEYGARAHAGARNNPNIMDTYAYTLCKNKKYTKAEKLLQTTIQLHEVGGTAVPWEVYKHLGMAQEGLERNELATASYKQAMQLAGDTITPKNKDQLTQAIERVSQ